MMVDILLLYYIAKDFLKFTSFLNKSCSKEEPYYLLSVTFRLKNLKQFFIYLFIQYRKISVLIFTTQKFISIVI